MAFTPQFLPGKKTIGPNPVFDPTSPDDGPERFTTPFNPDDFTFPDPTPKPQPSPFALPDPTQYFDPALLNRFFNIARGNLGAAQAGAGSQAARRAGAMAGGFLNPQSFVSSAATQATAPFAPAFGNLEVQRAQGLQGLQQNLFAALMQRALAERGTEEDRRRYELALQQLAEQRRQFDLGLGSRMDMFNRQLQAGEAGFFDYLGLGTGLAGSILPSLIKYGILCWIAEALYGINDERTWYARYVVNFIWPESRLGRFAKKLYARFGKRIAASRWVFLFRPVFSLIWRYGRRKLRQGVALQPT